MLKKKAVSGIMQALLLIGMLTFAFNVQRLESLESSSVIWNRTYGGPYADRAYSMVQTDDGGYALAGTAGYGTGWDLICLVKTDLLGNMQWIRSYGDPYYGGGWEGTAAYAVVQTSDGGYALAGYSPLNSGDFWLLKTDSDGIETWSRTYGAQNQEHSWDTAYSLIQTDDGGYVLAGSTFLQGSDAWLVKTDSLGNMLWNRTYGKGLVGPTSYYESAYSLIQTNDGGYAFAGTTTYGSYQHFWLVKTDSGGNEQWNQTYGEELAYSLIQTVDGGYALAGSTNSFTTGDFALVKTDAYGNVLWNETYGGAGSEEAFSVIQTGDGGYALAGFTTSFGAGSDDAWLMKTDPDGNMQWNETFGGTNEDQVWSVVQASDNEYVLGGWTKSFGDASGDFWLFKIAAQTHPRITGISRTPSAPNYDEIVTVTATITDDTAVDNALLSYTCDSTWCNATMGKSGDYYDANIPPQPYETMVQYKIYANDSDSNWAVSDTYSYTVGDFTEPETRLSQTPDYPLPTQKVIVYANVTEPVDASGVENVLLHHRANNGLWVNATMVFNEALGLYETKIPAYEKHDLVEYFVKATDNAGNINTTPIHHYEVLRCDANHNGVVDVYDIYMIGKAWNTRTGETEFIPEADINENGTIDEADLTILNTQYGKDP